MELAFDIAFEDLYRRPGLMRLDAAFLSRLPADRQVALQAARSNPGALDAKAESELMLALAPHLEDFLAELFGIGAEAAQLADAHHALAPLYRCQRLFVQRRALKSIKPEDAASLDPVALRTALFGHGITGPDTQDFELSYATHVMHWLEDEAANAQALDLAARYAAWAHHTPEGRDAHADGVLFDTPEKLDPFVLIPLRECERDGIGVATAPHIRPREGFGLTDPGADLVHALDEAHYCIYCAHQGRDSCSKGMWEKDGSPKKTALGVPLNGCPLEEHISEMNEMKAAGLSIAGLACATVNNPMCAGTGHRICNDCMKSCIYQKQEPVDIPQVETRTLRDVLSLPYGFEIYSLLTRWNPLNFARPMPLEDSGRKVLVAGMGPAGYTLAHHLLQDGHTVLGIDGLKTEPLPEKWRRLEPIRDASELWQDLAARPSGGFGGVAEYGITVRWDKNFLTVIRLLLERRERFALLGGVRFGGTITIDDAWAMGFDHLALCMGAGKPTVVPMENALARGVRTASDFLMALQLSGAGRSDSIANLQIRLPVAVIGGGLTAMDAATESLAYYPLQVEKFLARYETLCAAKGEASVRAAWDVEEAEIADEFIAHALSLREERQKPVPDIHSLLDAWGGVKILYRRRLIDAPSYRLNHEEVEKAFEEGIFFAEQWQPVGVELDKWGHAKALRIRSINPTRVQKDEPFSARCAQAEARSAEPRPEQTQAISIPARTVLMAAGTSPNTVIAREDGRGFLIENHYFQAVQAGDMSAVPTGKQRPARVLMHREADGRAISYFGDMHPDYAGNVVKAMGSARWGHATVSRAMADTPPASTEPAADFLARMSALLQPTVHAVHRLTPTIVEVVVRAPQAARKFQPGQFFRLQNFEANAAQSHGTTLSMEGLAMTGAWVDAENGLVSTIALEMGGSSDLCSLLKPGEPVVLMGPTGTPTEIPEGETVMLIGGGLGNAVLFSIGKAMREKGCKVLYFAGYKALQDRYKVAEIEAAADHIVWACDEAPGFAPCRPGDTSFTGNILEAIKSYAQGPQPIPLGAVERILAIGSDRMMHAVTQAVKGPLSLELGSARLAIGSINSPMQCMLKEICAQCLQRHVDPATGEESFVYSCFNQDQDLTRVDFAFLNQRLRQNSAQEKLTKQWIDHCLRGAGLREAA